LHLIVPYNIIFVFCTLAVKYNIDYAILLLLLLVLELITAVVGAQSCIFIVVVVVVVVVFFSPLFLMVEPSANQPKESNTQMPPLLFEALEVDGSNYLEWGIDARSYVCAEELDHTLESPMPGDFPATSKWKAILIMRRHLDVFLRQQYIQVDDPHSLWEQLEARFHLEKTIFLLHARNDWIHLRFFQLSDV
jgi:hypothetical protein